MTDVVNVKGVGKKTAEKLGSAKIDTAEKLAAATVDEVVALGIGKGTAAKIINNARELVESTIAEPVEEVKPPAEEPKEEVKETPAEEPVEESIEEPIEEPAEETIEEPVEETPVEEPVKVAEKPKKKAKKKTTPKRTIPDDYDEPTYSRKKKVAQVKKVEKEVEIIDESDLENRSTWVVKAKELSEEEKKKKAERKKIRSMADQITREIPSPPQPVKAIKTGKKAKSEKPVKKQKETKEVKVFEKKKRKVIEYYAPEDIKRSVRTFKVRGKSGVSNESKPRSVIEKGTALGFVSSHRRSRRDINNSQLIVQLNPEFDSEAVIGKTITFTYPDNGAVVVGNIYKRFGKRSSRKVLVKFEKGIRPISRYQIVYAK